MRQIPALTSLRFFAAIVVVVFHYNQSVIPILPWPIFGLGYEAVSFFFILSGFILTYVHSGEAKDGRLDSRSFFVARAARILPAYYFALAIAAPLLTLDLSGGVPWLSVAGLASVLLLLQAWVPMFADWWNYPAWSLSVESFFYVLFPALCRVFSRLRPLRLLFWAFGGVVAMGLVHETFFSKSVAIQPSTWFNFCCYFPVFHLPKFLFGMALARIFDERSISAKACETYLISGICALCGIVICHADAPWLISDVVLAPVLGSIILGAAGGSGPISKALSIKPLIFLGEASYATYITHIPLLLWWQSVDMRGLITIPSLEFAAYMFCLLALSSFTLIAIEKPARSLVRDWIRPKRGRVSLASPPASENAFIQPADVRVASPFLARGKVHWIRSTLPLLLLPATYFGAHALQDHLQHAAEAAIANKYEATDTRLGGACNFDESRVTDGDEVIASGWAAFPSEAVVGEAVFLQLNAAGGSERVTAQRGSRSDVAEYFKNDALKNSGFTAILKREPGTKVKLLQALGGHLYQCEVEYVIP